jgi:hypothetical protein
MITLPASEHFGMERSSNQREAELSLVPEPRTDTAIAVVALVQVQRLAAERRASAEESLAVARAFEERVAEECNTVTTLSVASDAAHAAEREAEERVRLSRERLEELAMMRQSEQQWYDDLRHAEESARLEVAGACERLELARRTLADAIAARSANPVPAPGPRPLEDEAQAEYEDAVRLLDGSRACRERADAEVAQMRVRVELLSGTSGLDTDAVRRVVERRLADKLRNETKEGSA